LLAYAKLWATACSRSIGYLRQPRKPSKTLPQQIPADRAYNNRILLLQYNFIYANFIRSMGLLYTFCSREIDAIWDIVDSVTHIPLTPGWPHIDFDCTFKAMTLGVLLAGHFSCSYHSLASCNIYDNHCMVKMPEVDKAIQEKSLKKKTCLIMLYSNVGYGDSSWDYLIIH